MPANLPLPLTAAALIACCAGMAQGQASTADCTAASVDWRVAMPGPLLRNRPAVGPNGEVGVQSSDLVVVEADGSVRWRQAVSNLSGDSICDFDAAGNVYANSLSGIRSFAADGSARWTLGAAGLGFKNHAGPTVGPDGNIYFCDVAFEGYGYASVTPDGDLRWSVPGFGDNDNDHRRIDVEFVRGLVLAAAPAIPDDCGGDCLGSGVMAFELDGDFAWTAHTTLPEQPVVSADGSVLVPVAPTGVRRIDSATGSNSPVSLNNRSNTGDAVVSGPDGTAYAVTNYNQIQAISPSGAVSQLASPGAIMGTPAISPDGTLLVVGTADSLLPSPNFITGIDTRTGDIVWSIPLPVENGWQLAAIGWPRFADDASAVYVGVNAGNDSYLYAIDLCSPGTGAECTADTNGDDALTPADFNAWIIAFNTNAPACDQNGDGLCSPADFNAWVLNYNTGCP